MNLIVVAGFAILAVVVGFPSFQWWQASQDAKKAERIIGLITKTVSSVPPVHLVVTAKTVVEDSLSQNCALAQYRTHRPKVEAIIKFEDHHDGHGRKLVDVAVASEKVHVLVVKHFRGKDGYDVSVWADDSFRIFIPVAKAGG